MKNYGSGIQNLTVAPAGGRELFPELQNQPDYPGEILEFDQSTIPFKVGLYTLMACDINKACWKLRPGYDTQWKSAPSMVHSQQNSNRCYMNFGAEVMLVGSCELQKMTDSNGTPSLSYVTILRSSALLGTTNSEQRNSLV